VRLTSSSAAGNQWYRNWVELPGETADHFDPKEEGIYVVQVQAGRCFSEFSQNVPVVVTGIAGTVEPVTAFPNPAEDLMLVRCPGRKILRITVTGMLSQEIDLPYEAGSDELRVDLRQLSPGVYIMRLATNEGSFPVRFVKK
jgi:hypothetical protein